MSLTPKNRKEEWLEGLVEHETTLTPRNRCEAWVKEIIDASGGGGGGGTGGGVLVCTPDMETGALDKTWKEITDAPFTVLKFTNDNITYDIGVLSSYDVLAQGTYYNVTFKVNEQTSFTGATTSPNGYPILQ